jgi:hypothetical protein
MANTNRFRRLGQQFTQSGQDLIRQKVDQPIEDIRQRMIESRAAEEGVLRSLSGRPAVPPQAMPQVATDPSSNFNGTMNAMDAQIELDRRDKAMIEQMKMEEIARKLQETEDANAVYQPVDRSRFQRIRQGLK